MGINELRRKVDPKYLSRLEEVLSIIPECDNYRFTLNKRQFEKALEISDTLFIEYNCMSGIVDCSLGRYRVMSNFAVMYVRYRLNANPEVMNTLVYVYQWDERLR